MKNIVFVMVTFATLIAGIAEAQDFSGTWQGTLLVNGREARLVIKISSDAGALKALLYNIDQGGNAIASGPLTLQGSNVKVPFPGIDGTYEGKLSPDGNALVGTWTRLQPQPLNLNRATAETAWTIPAPLAPLKPMAADANPKFEIATIKPSPLDDPRLPTMQIQPRRLLTWNKSVMNLISEAYSLNPREILNAPDWLNTKYDIVAQPDGEGQPSVRQWDLMLRKLLADRFQLSFHWDKKETSVYELSVTKSGAKLTASAGDPNGTPNLAMPARGRFRFRNATMADVAGELQGVLDRPVVDKTGISGHYDIALNWTPDDFQAAKLSGFPAPQQSNSEFPDLFSALQEQLGLRLESTKAPVDVMIIDHAEKPSEN